MRWSFAAAPKRCNSQWKSKIVSLTSEPPGSVTGCRRVAPCSGIGGKSGEERRAVRQAKAKPLIDAFKIWLNARLSEISRKSGLLRRSAMLLFIGRG